MTGIAIDGTTSRSYTRRLQARQQARWKRLLRVQAPYQWNLRRQRLGRTLEIGCGIGRNLATLGPGAVGVDHNRASVAVARAAGLEALDAAGWAASPLRRADAFDGILVAHVLEHMDEAAAAAMLEHYLPCLRPGGRVFMICPQERGYASDPTHVRFTDGAALAALARRVGLEPGRWFSFPFPRRLGRLFVYNEFCLLATKPG